MNNVGTAPLQIDSMRFSSGALTTNVTFPVSYPAESDGGRSRSLSHLPTRYIIKTVY
ncbi:MAG: hypothetical protein IPG53_02425 [Ignavibacteriales bacterium]|nr:hypothetical protein [Ignavibacteriales bacterium]